MKISIFRSPVIHMILSWAPALVMMAVIFYFSSLPSESVPRLDYGDIFLKKGGHLTGYAFLCLSLLRGMQKVNRKTSAVALALVVLYACGDEFHQSFVMGRHSSPIDVLIDVTGALLALWGVYSWSWLRRVVFWAGSSAFLNT